MKIAEAIKKRTELESSISELESKINMYSVIQEGTKLDEDPIELLKQLHLKHHQLEKITTNIHKTNLLVKTENGMLLGEAISRRDTLARQHGFLNMVTSIAGSHRRYDTKAEIRLVSTVDVPPLLQEMESLVEQKRLIEAEIQAANWANDLIEA